QARRQAHHLAGAQTELTTITSQRTRFGWLYRRTMHHVFLRSQQTAGAIMVTCYLRYILNPARLKEFEHYG
ncbi:hypothetical protein, partial [Proteus mirabilis]|uniref:hypothetical protein n=1 Tax=Proteus mirabilis TaxID=584 RepID=UPI003F683261